MLEKVFQTSGVTRYSIWWRKLIHAPLSAIFKLSLARKVKLIRNDHIPNGKPTIFTATHVFYDDIAAVLCTMKSAAYLLIETDGTESLPTGTDRLGLELNGVITVNRGSKESRAEALDNMVKVLNRRGNILMFPEAAWNFSPNALVAKLHWGAIRIAKLAGANIVPVAVDTIGDDYRVIIGSGINYENYETPHEAINTLRDKMATLTWELINLKSPAQREKLKDAHWLDHIRGECEKRPLEVRAKEESYMYRPKDEISLGEVLAEMHGIEYKSMAADYEQYMRIEQLIEGWTKPVRLRI